LTKLNRDISIPLHYQLKKWLKAKILSEQFNPVKPLPTEVELMKMFNLSKGTVRRAFSDLVHEGVIYRVSGKGTFIHTERLKNPVGGFEIGLVVISPRIIEKSYNPTNWQLQLEYVNGIMEVAQKNNIKTSFLVYSPSLISEHPEKKGFLFLDNFTDIINHAKQTGIPYTLIFPLHQISGDENCIALDYEDGFYKCIDYLIGLGHKRIAMIGMIDLVRVTSYSNALVANKLVYDENLVEPSLSDTEDGYKAAKQLINKTKEMDAVFCTTDLIAIGVLKAFREAGIGVPEDISVMGYDDINEAKLQNPPLTTMTFNRREIGQKAIKLLMEWINTKNSNYKPQIIIQKGKIIERGSTCNKGTTKCFGTMKPTL